jgi:hypothetical protein
MRAEWDRINWRNIPIALTTAGQPILAEVHSPPRLTDFASLGHNWGHGLLRRRHSQPPALTAP